MCADKQVHCMYSIRNLPWYTAMPNVKCVVMQWFYIIHVSCALIIVVFATIHINFMSIYVYGFILWGIDVVYRIVQTWHTVDVSAHVSEKDTLVTLIIPLEVRVFHAAL